MLAKASQDWSKGKVFTAIKRYQQQNSKRFFLCTLYRSINVYKMTMGSYILDHVRKESYRLIIREKKRDVQWRRREFNVVHHHLDHRGNKRKEKYNSCCLLIWSWEYIVFLLCLWWQYNIKRRHSAGAAHLFKMLMVKIRAEHMYWLYVCSMGWLV